MEKDPRPMIHVRLPRPLLKRLDILSVELETDRARALERVLEIGLPRAEEEATATS